MPKIYCATFLSKVKFQKLAARDKQTHLQTKLEPNEDYMHIHIGRTICRKWS